MRWMQKIIGAIQWVLCGIQKLVNDTLKNPATGAWSRKNVTGFSSFAYTIYYCTTGQWYDKSVHEFVVLGFLGVAVSCLGISSWEKVNIKKTDTAQPIEGGI